MIRSRGLAAAILGFSLLFGVAGGGHAEEAERRIASSPDADYFGGDYDVLKDVDANVCETACLADNRCQAFTLNRKTRWCFLKDSVGELRQAAGATSGRIVLASQAPDEDALEAREA